MFFAENDMLTNDVINGNKNLFRYNLIWDKSLSSDYHNRNLKPLDGNEHICIFYKKRPVYNPLKKLCTRTITRKYLLKDGSETTKEYIMKCTNKNEYPNKILRFPVLKHEKEKPVELLEYIINMYTNPGFTIMDNYMGNGAVAVVAKNTGRKFIGIQHSSRNYNLSTDKMREMQSETPILVKDSEN